MLRSIGKSNHFVLDRRAIAHASAKDLTGESWRIAEMITDQRMRSSIRMGDETADLRSRDVVGEHRERFRRIVASLNAELGVVDTACIQPGRRAGFQSAKREPGLLEASRKPDRRDIASPTCRPSCGSEVDFSPKESPRSQNHGPTTVKSAVGRDHAADMTIFVDRQITHLRLVDHQFGLFRQQGLNGFSVEHTISLGTWPSDRGPFASVQDAKLDPGCIDRSPHQPVKRVDFPDEMEPAHFAMLVDFVIRGEITDHIARTVLEEMFTNPGSPQAIIEERGLRTIQDEDVLGKIGMDSMLVDLETRLNRAAEAATPKARQLFITAINEMTLDDVMAIYNGPEDAATQYFRSKMSAHFNIY